VTTATKRLRRASIAGLATIATVGGVLAGTGGTAFAAASELAESVAASANPTIFPGTTANAVGDLTVSIPNLRSIGDTVTVQLAAAGASCGTTNGAVGFNGTPTVTVSGPFTAALGATAGTNAADVTPTFTVATASSAGACTVAGIKDQLVITLTNSGAAGDHYTFTVSNQKVNVGSAVTPGAVTETSNAHAATVATVSNTKASLAEVSAAASSTGVALNDLTLSEVTAGAFFPTGSTTVTLTLGGTAGITPLFTAGVTPTITVPAGYTTTNPVTTALNTYSFAVTAPATTVAATVTVKGLKVDLTAAGTGVVTLTATKAGPVTAGAAQNAIGVLNQARVGGVDRYATAAQLFTSGGFTGGAANVAVLASGANFPDALSANYLAAGLNAGAGTRILLTDPNTLVQPTAQALITSQIKTVYIVGGPAAVSASVANAIAGMHVGNNNANAFINVIRVAGADRYATNNQVDLYNGATAGVNTAVVAVGSNFADALSVAPAVVAKKYPLVLTDGGSLTGSAQSTLVNLGIKNVVIVGGTAAVSTAVETAIKNLGIKVAYRLAGADRTGTAQQIATWETTGTGTAAFPATSAYGALNGLGLAAGQVYIARGDGFADALSAGTVAGGVGGAAQGAILLTGSPTILGAGIPGYLSGKAATITSVTALGLTSAVSSATLNAAIASIS